MEDLYRRIGMPVNLRELGITPTDAQIEELAEGCARATGGRTGAAKVLYREDMANIYRLTR